jgi:phage minor structural protein
MNGDFTLTVKYPISDSGIYQLIQEDMLIKAPTPVLGAQLFRIKKPVEHNDHLEITAYHISDDVMQRSITPISVTSQSCGMALSRMVQNTKTALGDFSFNSDIQDRRTFNTTETETLYSVLLDGKHSIVGTWEGELVRDNFAMTVKKNRGENRGVVITTHKNLKDYQRTRNSQNVVTRIHAKSTFKTEGAEKETTIRVTVDSPLINSYPYINEKEYENNNAKTVEELQKWAQSKFSNEDIDKVSDAIKIEAYELDGQVVHMGDTVNLKSLKHNVDSFKKAIAYEFDALKEEYISLTFDDKAGVGFSRASGGLSSAADAILGVTESAQEVALGKALQNADLDFDHKAGLLRQEISDGIELARARAEEVKRELSDTIDQRFSSFNNGPLQEAKRRAEEALLNAGASSLLAQEAKQISERARADIATLRQNISNDYVAKSQHVEDVRGLTRRFEEINLGSPNLIINGAAELGDRNWGGTNGKWFTNRTHGFYKNSSVPLFTIDTKEARLCYIQTGRYNQLKKNTDYTLSFTGFMSGNVSGFRVMVGLLSNKDDVWKKTLGVFNQRLSPKQAERFTVQFNSGDYDGFSLRFDNFGSTDGQSATVWITEIDVYEGTMKRAYQPAPENNQNYADAKISEYRTTVDGRFASITSQIAGKANLLDFQRVQETSKLYERIIGRSESDIADKVARMALTNQLFQVEVAKASAGGRNLFLNSLFKRDLHQRYSTYYVDDSVEQTQGQLSLSIDTNTKFRGANTLKIVSTFNGKPNNQKVTFRTGGDMRLNTVDEMRNKSVRFSFWAKSTVNNTNFQARAGHRNTVEGVSLTTDWKFYDIQLTKSENSNASNEVIMHVFTAATVWIAFPKAEVGTVSTDFSEAPEDTDESIRSVQSQLAGSWAVQNLTSAGSIVSQINATNNQILIEAEKIRLKGKTLLDELTAIQGYFKRLFVGEGTFAKLNAEIIGSRTITADKLIMDQAMARMFVSSDIFTDTLAAKEAFINKLRSVVVSATLLEGFKGRIGGFQIGTHDKDPSTYWLTGQNQFYVGMSNGAGNWGKTALWVNWGTTWDAPGNYAWFVKESGEMFCYNRAYFWNTPVINGDLRVTGDIYYNNENSGKSGYWIYSPQYKQIFSDNGYMYFVWSGGGSSWVPLNKEISDRRYKHNIQDSQVSALDAIERLKTYSYRKEYDGKIEDISCGIMAQDVQKYVPEAFFENPDGAYSYRTFELVPYLIKAIQELNQKIEKLEKTA